MEPRHSEWECRSSALLRPNVCDRHKIWVCLVDCLITRLSLPANGAGQTGAGGLIHVILFFGGEIGLQHWRLALAEDLNLHLSLLYTTCPFA